MLNILSASPKDEASKILKKSGYRILSRDAKEMVSVNIGEKKHLGVLRVDFIAKKNGKSYVAAVLSGEAPADPTDPDLRKTLIEYDRVFGLDGILLVNTAAGTIERVSFNYPKDRGIDFYFQFAMGLFIIAGIIGIIWLMVQLRLY